VLPIAYYLFHMQPKCAYFQMISCSSSKMYCRKKGIQFVAIDQKLPLSDQGPFDIVLHKVSYMEYILLCSCIFCLLNFDYFLLSEIFLISLITKR
jgi:hypothetical protein